MGRTLRALGSERWAALFGEGVIASKEVVQRGTVMGEVRTDEISLWLCKVRASLEALGCMEGYMAEMKVEEMQQNALMYGRVEKLATLYGVYEGIMQKQSKTMGAMAVGYGYLVADVWGNWALGLGFGGAVVLGLGSWVVSARRVPWRRKWLGLLPAVLGTGVVIWCYKDHPPSMMEPYVRAIWAAFYGGAMVGFVATVVMVMFPAIIKWVGKVTLGGGREEASGRNCE